MVIPPYRTLSDFHDAFTQPSYNYLKLHQVPCLGQKAHPALYWVILWEELAQVPEITHPFGISKEEASNQELSWHQGLQLIIQQD